MYGVYIFSQITEYSIYSNTLSEVVFYLGYANTINSLLIVNGILEILALLVIGSHFKLKGVVRYFFLMPGILTALLGIFTLESHRLLHNIFGYLFPLSFLILQYIFVKRLYLKRFTIFTYSLLLIQIVLLALSMYLSKGISLLVEMAYIIPATIWAAVAISKVFVKNYE